MNTTAHLSIAGYKSIYNVADVDRAMEESSSSKNDSLKSLYEKMIRSGGMRYIIKPTSTEGVDSLYDNAPNFTEVIDDIKKQMSLAISGCESIQITPILLLGEPGLGKTHFAKSVAQILGTGFELISMNSLTAGWVLSGASSQWTNSKPGKVAQTLVSGEFANPLITLDEIDKAGGDSRYDPMGALYSLLEKDTARHFKDEFIEVPVDASHILWIATANDESTIPEPILNRMNVYTIERPDYEGSLKIALAVYQDILNDHNWGFPSVPSQEVLEKLTEIAPRNMRKILIDAFGNANMAKRDELQPDDLHTNKLVKSKNRIGF